MHHVFLSHSSKDKVFVRELYRRLTRDGVSCFFDAESIGWGANWVKALERAIDDCEQIVFILSPDFCNSDWVEVERTSSITDDPSGLKRKVRPLMLRACSDLSTFPRFLRQVQAIDVSTNALFDKNYPRICQDLGGIPRDDAAFSDRTKLPPVHPLPERHRMPYHSLGDKFIGRVDSLWNLHGSLHRDSTTILQGTGVIVGTGGLGKTQLAIEYAHRFGIAYSGGVYWVDAERGLSALIAQVSDASGIRVNTKAEESVQVEQIWRGLNNLPGPSLLILDNLPENVPLRPYLPTTGPVHTVITTRRQDLGYASVLLNTLRAEEGMRLLNSGARQFGADAAALVERLGGLPLALELAKSYLNYRKQLGSTDLLADLDRAGEIDVLNEFASEYRDQLPSRHEVDVVRTFQMSWDVAPEAAKQVLRVMGELGPAAVPRSLLRTVVSLPEQRGMGDSLSKSLDELARLSLVDLDTNGNPIAHRLIIAFIRYRNVADQASPFDQCRNTIQARLSLTFENPDASTIRELELLVPHAEFLLTTDRLSPEHASDLAGRLGEHHRTLGRYTAARQAAAKALNIATETYEPGHPSIASSQSNLALVLHDLGQLEEARDLLRNAVAAAGETYESGHPSMARGRSNLAMVLMDLGQLEEARDLLRKALASDE
jgi:tetratricopeptide (TPR) repeat protein